MTFIHDILSLCQCWLTSSFCASQASSNSHFTTTKWKSISLFLSQSLLVLHFSLKFYIRYVLHCFSLSSFAQKSRVDFYILHIHFIGGLPCYLSFFYCFHFVNELHYYLCMKTQELCSCNASSVYYVYSFVVLVFVEMEHQLICCFVEMKHQHEAFIVEWIIMVIELLQFFPNKVPLS